MKSNAAFTRAASKCLGAFAGGDARRAENARQAVRRSVCGGAMGGDALIDTGAILALLDRTDRWHRMSASRRSTNFGCLW